jgi:hypothetical protein
MWHIFYLICTLFVVFNALFIAYDIKQWFVWLGTSTMWFVTYIVGSGLIAFAAHLMHAEILDVFGQLLLLVFVGWKIIKTANSFLRWLKDQFLIHIKPMFTR